MAHPGPAAAAASLALPIAALWIWQRSWWPLLVFVLWALAVMAVVIAWQNRKHKERCEKLLAHSQQSAIRTLSHHRHDWMNELQIMYGYLKLNKHDKAIEVVDRIRTRMEKDSRMSQIGHPALATYLLSFRTFCDSLRLEVDVQDGLQLDKLPMDAERLSGTIIGLVNVIRYRASVPTYGENVLRLGMGLDEGRLKIVMRYSGELAAASTVTEELEKCLNGTGKVTKGIEPAEQAQQERTMVIHVPLPA